jgi:hypothetical protein
MCVMMYLDHTADIPIQKGWNTTELQEDFEVLGFMWGLCAVRRKADGVKGTLDFDHAPRRYYNFLEA